MTKFFNKNTAKGVAIIAGAGVTGYLGYQGYLFSKGSKIPSGGIIQDL